MHSGRSRLLADLARHVPENDVERAHLAAIQRLVESEPRCFERSMFTPGHITASAYVVDDAGRLLLHHHRRLDRWLQLGGHDEGENDPALAALREAREESGLEDLTADTAAILDVDVHAIPSARGEPEHLHHDIRYLLRTRTPDAIRIDEAESRALAFFDLDEAAARLGERRVVDKIRRALARSS